MNTARRYFSVVCFLMFLAAAAPVSALVGGYPMPSLDDEKNTYARFGWTVTGSTTQPSSFPASTTYTVTDPAIHQDTEGDDLWMYTMQWQRTGVIGYLNRAKAWARYMRDDYRQCIPGGVGNSGTYCWDLANHELDHVYVNGLITYYELTGDTSYKTAAENICADINTIWTVNRPGAPGTISMAAGMRGRARQLLAAVRCAERNSSFNTLRNRLIDLWVQSPDWELKGSSGGGMYFASQFTTDSVAGSGRYAGGLRLQGGFHIGALAEAFFHAYRTTGRTDVRDKIVAIARYVKDFGLNPTTQHTGTWYGVEANGTHYQSDEGAAYTISQVNALIFGSMFTTGSEKTGLESRAKTQFNRGTKYACCPATGQGTPDNEADHFLDTEPDSASGNFFMGHNKGELQYAWAIFLPVTDSVLAATAKSLAVGAWAEITGSNINSVMTASGSSGHKVGFAISGVWDTGLRAMLFCGSDHPDPSTCMRYNDATNSWSIHTPAFSGGIQHGYDHSSIDVVRRRFYHRPFGSSQVWRCDITTATSCASTWAVAFTITDFGDCCIGTDFAQWKNPDGVLLMNMSLDGVSTARVRQFDPVAGTVSQLATYSPQGVSFLQCTDGPPHLCYMGTEEVTFRAINDANQVSSLADAPCSTYENTSVSTPDPITGDLMFGCSSTWHRYNSASNTWTQLAGPHPPNQFVGNWSNGALAFPIPSYGVIGVVGCNGGNCRMWIYKPAALLPPQAGSSDTTPPDSPFLRAP